MRVVDKRLAMVDTILADVSECSNDQAVKLGAAGNRSAAEVEAVLDELDRLRLQMGMVALSGDSLSVQECLAALTARVRALDELSRIEA